jgi:hypothetical protein
MSIELGKRPVQQENPLQFVWNKKQGEVERSNIKTQIAALIEHIKASSPEFRTTNEFSNDWNEVEDKRELILNSMATLTGKLRNIKFTKYETNGYIYFLLKTARDLLIIENLNEQEASASNHNFFELYHPIRQLLEVHMGVSLRTKIGETSLFDIFNNKSNPSDYYSATVEAALATNNNSQDKFLPEKTGNKLIDDSVNLARESIFNTCLQTIATSIIAPDEFKEFNQLNLKKGEQEIVNKAIKLVKQTSQIKKTIFENIFLKYDTNSFESERIILERYLNEDTAGVALDLLGLNELKTLLLGYRESKRLIKEDSSLYGKLEKHIKDYSKTIPQAYKVFSSDDIDLFLNNENIHPLSPVPTFEELKEKSSQIIRLSPSKAEYIVDPQTVISDGFNPPQKIILKFLSISPENPKFSVNLFYEPEKDKVFESVFIIYAKDQELSWNFLEEPSDLDMKFMRDATMRYIKNILSTIQKNIELEYLQTQKQTQPIIKTHVEKPPYEAEAEKVTLPKPPTPINVELSKENSDQAEAKTEIRGHISFPKNVKIEKILKRIPSENQPELIAEIERYNRGESNSVKMLTDHARHNKKPVFELVKNDFRTLLTMIAPSEKGYKGINQGKPEFEVYDAGNRKIYRKKQHGKNYR